MLEFANLEEADLHLARLTRATLLGANLKRANFNNTELSEACLADADLREALITVEMLSKASELRGATLPDGMRYWGFYNLHLDILAAQELGVDIDDENAMANFYGVSVEEYQQGQEWAKQHLIKQGEESDISITMRCSWLDRLHERARKR